MKKYSHLPILLSCLLALSPAASVPVHAEESGAAPHLYLAQFDDPAMQRRATAESPAIFTVSNGVSVADEAPALPAVFDLRKEGLVTPVKNQNPYRTCWAFAAVNSLENSQIKRNPLIDLSEKHLAYYTYCEMFGYPTTAEDILDEGSYDINQELGMLTSWMGPVDEADVPYYSFVLEEQQQTMDEVRSSAKYHVTKAVTYPYWQWDTDVFPEQMNAIKKSVYEGNALAVRYYECDECFNTDTNAYFYDSSLAEDAGWHSVSIVGWNDNFPASAFTSDPGRDGAWLVKNSWGTNWGDNGYFWLSYADENISGIYELETESAKAHTRLYQYDDFGNSGSFATSTEGDTSVLFSNMFTADTDGWMTSVMLCNTTVDTGYEITVYTGLTDPKNPMSGTASAVTSGTLTELGYQTIGLNAPVSLTKGELFSVVVKLTNANKEYLIPIEYATHSEWTNSDGSVESSNSVFTEEMLRRSFAAGQSFYSEDGSVWYDMSEVAESGDTTTYDDGTSYTYRGITGNICLKAVVNDRGAVTFSDYCEKLPIGEEITLSCIEDTPIHYSVNDGEYQLYSGPITYNGEMTIKAYADTDVNTIYEMHYTTARSELTSLLGIENTFSDYFFTNEGEKDTLRYNVYEGTTTLDVLPVANGKITIGDTTLPSGEITTLDLKHGVTTFDLQVEQPDLEPTTYRLIVNEMLSIMYGDVNEDGDINSVDASEVLVYAAITGLGQDAGKSEDWKQRADYNRDGQIDSSDASSILVFAAQAGLYS